MRYTRFEKARVIGARGLQIAMGAPVLVELLETCVDPIEIATVEYEEGMIPISIKK
ncbi:MAG: DNA-directed RNA polymerase subunit K [Candidatus Thermoplasmatota archaeon]|nr:DNA-directed RNA polymerase subunit K [Candidatus Thermoplasmatota archaeon]